LHRYLKAEHEYNQEKKRKHYFLVFPKRDTALGFISLHFAFDLPSNGGKGLFETLSNPQTNGSLGFPRPVDSILNFFKISIVIRRPYNESFMLACLRKPSADAMHISTLKRLKCACA
jgi:hypothetical protein